MTPSAVILLFDIDGTLIRTDGAGRRALNRAFSALFDREQVLAGYDFGGRTDPIILKEGLQRLGVSGTPEIFERLTERYLFFLEDELERSDGYQVMPCVPEVLQAVSGRDGIAMGLGTGNMERGARLKLAVGGLNDWFAFGGFGSDAEDRGELLLAGAKRGAAIQGVALEDCRVVIIGDTTRDVLAAQQIGAECLAVATGSCSMDELGSTGPDRLAATLGEDDVCEWLLRSGS